MADDESEGVGLPQKGLNMIIKDALPEMRIANETRELLNQCCVEFVKHVSREAQQISSKDQRKTIYHDHVQKALKNLGFPREYVDAANSVLGECKIAAEKRLKRKNSRLDKCGIPEDQLWQMQQQLIEQARRSEAEKQQQLAGQFGVGGGGPFVDFPQQMAASQIGAGGGGEFVGGVHVHQQQQMQAAWQQNTLLPPPDIQPQFLPPAPPPNALAATEIGQQQSSSSSAAQQSSSSALPPMLMPFGLNPQQLIVPQSSASIGLHQFGGMSSSSAAMLDPNVAAAAQLLFNKNKQSTMAQKKEGGGEEEEEEEGDEDEEDDEDNYDV